MKIIFIAYEFPPHEGGMQTYAYELVKELSKNNEILVICKKESRNFLIKDLTLYPILSKDKNNYFTNDMINCLRIIKNERPDIVHILNSGFSYFSVYLKRVLKIPVIITAHAKDFLQPWISPKVDKEKIKQLIVDGLNNSDSIIAVSNYTKKKLIEMGVKKKISVIFNGCDPNKFYPKEKDKKILRKLKIKENEKVLLTISRLTERKGQDIVIKSLPFVLKKFPETKYLLVGRQVVGNEKKKLKRLIKKLNLKKHVIFLDYIKNKELINYYNLCDIFILTTKEIRIDNFLDVEGFGIVYLEAGCCEKAVIASKSGGVSDAVINEKTGILVKSEDIKETAETIIKLLENPKLSKRLGENGRKRVIRDLNWEKISKRIFKLYKQAIKKCEKVTNMNRKIDEYKPKRYWEERLKKHFNFKGVGHISFNETYNKYLYLLKKSALDRVLDIYSIKIKDKSILDVGCGTGFFINYYNNIGAKNITGIDITKISISALKKEYPLHKFQVSDIGDTNLSLKKTFDIINTFDVLYHITDDKKFKNAIKNISKLCNRGGYVLVTDSFWKEDIIPAKHVKFRSLQKYKEEFSKNGIDILGVFPMYYLMNQNFPLSVYILNKISPAFYFIDKTLQKMSIQNGLNIKLLIGKKI